MPGHHNGPGGRHLMLDLLFISLTLAFFALCFGYVAWCDRLMK